MTLSHEKSLRVAGNLSVATNKPIVVDLVGYGITMQRQQLGLSLVANQPTIVKGNISEMRRFVGLSTSACGVDSDIAAEIADEKTIGMEDFRRETLNQISLLKNDVNWLAAIRYFDKV